MCFTQGMQKSQFFVISSWGTFLNSVFWRKTCQTRPKSSLKGYPIISTLILHYPTILSTLFKAINSIQNPKLDSLNSNLSTSSLIHSYSSSHQNSLHNNNNNNIFKFGSYGFCLSSWRVGFSSSLLSTFLKKCYFDFWAFYLY